MPETQGKPRVGLFVTCLVDLFRPTVGFAAVKLLEAAGCTVEVPAAQTCCGQPAYNSGDRKDTRAIAEQVIAAFEPYDYVVAPSGSCAGMLKVHYPTLFADDAAWEARVEAFSAKVFELVSFLVDVRGMTQVEATFDGAVTYHDSCAGLRELGVREQPRKLLASVAGLTLKRARARPMSAAASAAPSASSTPTSPTPSSRRRRRRSSRPAPARCSPAISAA